MRGAIILSPNTTTSAAAPTATVTIWASPRVPIQDHSSWIGLEPVTFVPVSLGSSPITTSIAAPNRKPVTTARDRNCAIHPIFSTARSKEQHARNEGDQRHEGRHVMDPRDPGHRDRARGHGRQSRTRPGGDLPARPEDRIKDRAGGGRVQTVLQRDPRNPGVTEVLRDDQGSHSHPGDEITPEPATLVGSDPSGHRDETPSVTRRYCPGPAHWCTRCEIRTCLRLQSGGSRPRYGLMRTTRRAAGPRAGRPGVPSRLPWTGRSSAPCRRTCSSPRRPCRG